MLKFPNLSIFKGTFKNRNPPDTPPTTPPFPLLSLPIDLRLEIFSHCSAFTLLQLTHTHPLLRAEINGHPSLLRSSLGFAKLKYSRRGGTIYPNHNIKLVWLLIGVHEIHLYIDQYRDKKGSGVACVSCRQVLPPEKFVYSRRNVGRFKLSPKGPGSSKESVKYEICDICLSLSKSRPGERTYW